MHFLGTFIELKVSWTLVSCLALSRGPPRSQLLYIHDKNCSYKLPDERRLSCGMVPSRIKKHLNCSPMDTRNSELQALASAQKPSRSTSSGETVDDNSYWPPEPRRHYVLVFLKSFWAPRDSWKPERWQQQQHYWCSSSFRLGRNKNLTSTFHSRWTSSCRCGKSHRYNVMLSTW